MLIPNRENAKVDDDPDLEEGEIASDDDDEEIQHGDEKQEDKTGVKPTTLEGDMAKQDLKTQTVNQPEKPDSLNAKGAAISAEKRRDKRVTSNSNNSRTRKRAGDDDLPSHRDSNVCSNNIRQEFIPFEYFLALLQISYITI